MSIFEKYDKEFKSRLEACEKKASEVEKSFILDKTDSRPFIEQKEEATQKAFEDALKEFLGYYSDYDISQFKAYKSKESIDFLKQAGWSIEQLAIHQESKEGKEILGNLYFEEKLNYNGKNGTTSVEDEIKQRIAEFERKNKIDHWNENYESDTRIWALAYDETEPINHRKRVYLKEYIAETMKKVLAERIGPDSGFKLETFGDWSDKSKVKGLLASGWSIEDLVKVNPDLDGNKKLENLDYDSKNFAFKSKEVDNIELSLKHNVKLDVFVPYSERVYEGRDGYEPDL